MAANKSDSLERWIDEQTRNVVYVGSIPGLGDAARVLDRVPSLSSFLEGDPPITTSLDDARTEIAFLDGYAPDAWTSMTRLTRTSLGAFQLRPGRYALEAQSYCMHAGTHGPGGGDGYLYAPLVGPKAPIIRSLLRNSVDHPEIPQRDIQVLIWAIIARTEFDEMTPEMQRTARALLSRDQVEDLDDGALGMVPESVMRQAMNRLPPVAQQVFQAEARLRSMISSGTSSFADLERVAVLTGAATPTADSRPVPEGRWSYHPDGFFVRYAPQGYSHTRIEVVVPRPVTIARDAEGRIVAVVEGSGRKIEVEYDDASAEVAGDAGVRAYGLRSVVATERRGEPTIVVSGGWTLVGVPRGAGRASGAGRFADLAGRYRAAQAWRDEVRSLIGRRAGDSGLADALDLAQLHLSIEEAAARPATPGGGDAISAAAETALVSLAEAWQAAVCGATGCPSTTGVTDVLVLRNGEVRLGALTGCGGESCWFAGSGVGLESIAWIGLATAGLPPAAQNADVDEVHLVSGTVRPGELGAVTMESVWTAAGGYNRDAVEWIHLAGTEEVAPTDVAPAGGGGAEETRPTNPPEDEDEDDEDDEDEDQENEDDGGDDDGFAFDPSGDVATPGNRARQRLATSGRPYGNSGEDAGDDEADQDGEDDCAPELRNVDQAAAMMELYRLQHGECYTDPRAPSSTVEDCTGEIVFDDVEQIEYERLYDNWSEAFGIWTECILRE